MSRCVVGLGPNADLHWINQNQNEIQNHLAWCGSISEQNAEELLKNKSAFTYLLRKGDNPYSYFISFVKEDHSIKHQFFVLEVDRKGWFYRNGIATDSPAEVGSKDLNQLIPMIMHCEPNFITPLIFS
jgi:hypothetical protein